MFGGEDVTRLAPYEVARRGIARTFQSVNLVDDLTALDNVAVARAGLGEGGLWRALGDDGLERARGYAVGLLERLDVAHVAMQPAVGSPTASSAGSRSPARSRSSRCSCCSTSRPRA